MLKYVIDKSLRFRPTVSLKWLNQQTVTFVEIDNSFYHITKLVFNVI